MKIDATHLLKLMQNQDNIRFISIVSSTGAGKTSVRNILDYAKALYQPNLKTCIRNYDYKQWSEENLRINEISENVYNMLYYSHVQQANEKQFLINFINSEDQIKHSLGNSATLRIVDGVLFVIDFYTFSSTQNDAILRQILFQKIKPVFLINKLDIMFNSEMNGQAIYKKLQTIINDINTSIKIFTLEGEFEGYQIQPNKGNIVFGSAKQSWFFTLKSFAIAYSTKFGIEYHKIIDKLWGDNYYFFQQKKWKNSTQNDKNIQRSFVSFIIEPILKLNKAVMQGQKQFLSKLLKQLNIDLNQKQSSQQGETLFKTIMNKWIPSKNNILQMIVVHLPSPKKAQQYRTKYLFQGSQNDPCTNAINHCDVNGPLVAFISKFVLSISNKVYGLGRIFSGKIQYGKSVKIMGQQYKVGGKYNIYEKKLYSNYIQINNILQQLTEIPCGNIVLLMNIEDKVNKTATISDITNIYPIKPIKYHNNSSVFKTNVIPKHPNQLQPLLNRLKLLSKLHPQLTIQYQDTGQIIVSSADQLHLKMILQFVQNTISLENTDPFVTYYETVTQSSPDPLLSKSQNKFNRIQSRGSTLNYQLQQKIINKQIGQQTDKKIRNQILVKTFQWGQQDAQNIWFFGPDFNGPNIFVEAAKYCDKKLSNQIKEYIGASFQFITKKGVLIQQNIRGLRIDLTDCHLISDAIHRGGGQIIPAARRNMYACQLTSSPTLLQPIFSSEITLPKQYVQQVKKSLVRRKGQILSQKQHNSIPITTILSYLPVVQSFGLNDQLKQICNQTYVYSNTLDNWQMIKGSPLQQGSDAQYLVQSIRKRKGLSMSIPQLSLLTNKL